jgi:hypothetical protein
MCLYKTIVYYLELLLYHIKLAIDENLIQMQMCGAYAMVRNAGHACCT